MAMVQIEQHEDTKTETLIQAVFSALHRPHGPCLVRSMEAYAESRLSAGSRVRFSDVYNGQRFIIAHYAGFDWRINAEIAHDFQDFRIWDLVSIWRSDD